MMAGVFRVLGALVGSVAVFAFWGLFIVAIMVVTLYICRFIPLSGLRKNRDGRSPNEKLKHYRSGSG
jgi:hypothetical protein